MLERDSDAAAGTLVAIAAAGRQAMVELERLAGILESSPAAMAGDDMTVQRLAELIARFRQAGLPVDLRFEVLPSAAPLATTGTTMLLVIQEGLTNVLKHAGPVPTRVSVHQHEEILRVQIVNDGPRHQRPAFPIGGHRILGMRERVELTGGTLSAEHREGGWELSVELPLDAMPRVPLSAHRSVSG